VRWYTLWCYVRAVLLLVGIVVVVSAFVAWLITGTNWMAGEPPKSRLVKVLVWVPIAVVIVAIIQAVAMGVCNW